MAWPADLYCTDEDLTIACGADYHRLVTSDVRQAQGTDGVITAFTLSSASSDFVAQDVMDHMAIRLARGGGIPGDILIVDGLLSPTALTMRRKGQATGKGAPPGPAASGVHFEVFTSIALIREHSRMLAGRYAPSGTEPCAAADFKRSCVLMVLIDLYGQLHLAGDQLDNFLRKREQYLKELDAELARVAQLCGGVVPVEPGELASHAGAIGHMDDLSTWRIPPGY